jgi:hypothetical protein
MLDYYLSNRNVRLLLKYAMLPFHQPSCYMPLPFHDNPVIKTCKNVSCINLIPSSLAFSNQPSLCLEDERIGVPNPDILATLQVKDDSQR